MNLKKVPVYQGKLERIRQELLGGVEKSLKSSQEENGHAVADISDEAARDYNNQLMLNLGQQDWEKLKQVEEALESIKTGDYGICRQCEEPIPEKRLNIVPFAKYCVQCLNSIEKEKSVDQRQQTHFK